MRAETSGLVAFCCDLAPEIAGTIEIQDLYETMSKGETYQLKKYMITGGVLLEQENVERFKRYYLHLGKEGGKRLVNCDVIQDHVDKAKQLKIGQEVKIIGTIGSFDSNGDYIYVGGTHITTK